MRTDPVPPFPANVHGIKAVLRFLRAQAGVYGYDPKRIAIAGTSSGGHLATLVGVSNGNKELEGELGGHRGMSSDVQAIVSFYGAANLQTILGQSTAHGLSVRGPALQLLLGGQPDEKPALARLASPVTHVGKPDPPLLLIHGDADPRGEFSVSNRLAFAAQLGIESVRHLMNVERCLMWVGLLACGLSLVEPGWALEWVHGQGCRYAKLGVQQAGSPGFTLRTSSSTGIGFSNILSADRAVENQIRLNGSGLALGDVDGDGRCDVFLCGLENENRLYRNLGEFRFEDVTGRSGVACPRLYCTGAVLADVEGDSDLDLLVTALGDGTRLFLNDGRGHFSMATEAGLVARFGAGTMTLADIDGDGDLDLYVANYQSVTMRDTGVRVLVINGERRVMPEDRHRLEITPDGRILEFGEPDLLYLNDGKGHFTAVSWTNGVFSDETGRPLDAPPRDWGLSAMFRDITGDGAPDLYVCNDFFSPDRFWINDGRGRFRVADPASLRSTSLGAMAVDFADVNRDGFDDFMVVDMMPQDHLLLMTQREPNAPSPESMEKFGVRPQFQRNTLHLNRGDGSFAEIAQLSGVEASGWSWGVAFVDVDLDGFEDLLIVGGQPYDTSDADTSLRLPNLPPDRARRRLLEFPPHPVAKVAFRNRGDLTFTAAGAAWGFDTVGVSHGLALADLDGDGDLDVVVNDVNGPAGLFRNNSPAPRLAVRLQGLPPNTRGIGARLKVTGGPVVQTQEMICGGRYCSSDDPLRVFACGAATHLNIEVTWRSGRRSRITNAIPNHLYEIQESAAALPGAGVVVAVPPPGPLFVDVSARLKHTHIDTPFNDFERQPLLPAQLSQLGPGVSWFDLDGDGWDDLMIASGNGGRLASYRNDGKGAFARGEGAPWDRPVTRDQTTVLGYRTPAGKAVVLGGSANYEDGLALGAAARAYDVEAGTVEDLLPGQASATGPMAMGDIDGDGELDLVIGGRVLPGRYPEAASSLVFRGVRGRWVADGENTRRLATIGLVSGIALTDLDEDGDPDLVLACEWGPLRVLRNDRHRFTDVTAEWGLHQYKGWWNGVAAGDFDEDGQMDLVASNAGRNTKYQRYREQPLRVYHGDWRGDGTVALLEAVFSASAGRVVPVPALDVVGAALPFVAEKFPTFKAYGEARMEDILAGRPAAELQVNWLESTVFLNRGSRFEARPLPVEAQFSPAYAVCAGDLDGDGHEDLFLSQNFFATNPDTSRSDAGLGLCLRGDGQGGFTALPSQESGIRIPGEQRGAALSDFDGDGRVDLVVAQNSAETKLYRNTRASPGLRVRLNGPPGNPSGVGATIRLSLGSRHGPAREIHAGSGYWSQDSAVQVLGVPQAASRIFVRWPGGKTMTATVPPDAREITAEFTGQVRLIR